MPTQTKSARIHKTLRHPVVDGDGHWLEPMPVLMEYFREIAGAKLTDDFIKNWTTRSGRTWYTTDPAQRQQQRMTRVPWWTQPANALDRATTMVPRLLHERLPEFGIDFSVIYPSLGLYVYPQPDPDIRRAFGRALNTMNADLFRPYSDRLAPVAIVTTNTPSEAIEEAEYAVKTLGMKGIVINGAVRRPIAADAEWQSDPARRRPYIDNLSLDSAYDYDPFWKKCLELKVAVTTHVGSMGWMDRSSPTNFVSNHLGHFAQASHSFARNLFLAGVPQRFPALKFAFLEGGVGWGCNLLSDLIGHWKKRSVQSMNAHLRPTNIDREEFRRLYEQYATDPRLKKQLATIVEHNLFPIDPQTTLEQLAERDRDADDFGAVKISSPDDIRRVFAENFYFGCEADDPITSWAFNTKVNRTTLKALFSSDIAHFDVIDMREVLEEAYELVDDGLLDEQQFRAFTFANAVSLHGGMNPDFFNGTVVEAEAARELSRPAAALAKNAA